MKESISDQLNRLPEEVSDRRNGSYQRHVLTEIGDILLTVPRTRTYTPLNILEAYARRSKEVDRLILACFLLGLSTRKVGKVPVTILGEKISPTTVSRVSTTLDVASSAFHRRKLSNVYRALIFDGIVLSRKTGMGALKRPVLVVLSIRHDGKKEVIDFCIVALESAAGWDSFLADLWRQGLTLDKIRKADHKAAKEGLRKIYGAAHILEARQQANRWKRRWEQNYPAAVKCLFADIDDLFTCSRFKDPAFQKAIRTTNHIERRFKEVCRRTRPTCLPCTGRWEYSAIGPAWTNSLCCLYV